MGMVLKKIGICNNKDGAGFLDVLGGRWGDVCGSSDIASQLADELLPVIRRTWKETKQGTFAYFRGTESFDDLIIPF